MLDMLIPLQCKHLILIIFVSLMQVIRSRSQNFVKRQLVSELPESSLWPEKHGDMNMNSSRCGFLEQETVCDTYPSHPRCKRAEEVATQFDSI